MAYEEIVFENIGTFLINEFKFLKNSIIWILASGNKSADEFASYANMISRIKEETKKENIFLIGHIFDPTLKSINNFEDKNHSIESKVKYFTRDILKIFNQKTQNRNTIIRKNRDYINEFLSSGIKYYICVNKKKIVGQDFFVNKTR